MKPDPTRWTDPASGVPGQLRRALTELRERSVDAEAVRVLTERLCSRSALPDRAAPRSGTSHSLSRILWVCGGLALLGPSGPSPAASHRVAQLEPSVDVAAAGSLPSEHTPAADGGEESSALVGPSAAPAHLSPPAARKKASHAQRPDRVAPDPQSELALLQRAQAELDRDAERALALTELHARDYPRGIFEPEREILAIEALLKLARDSQARARALAFIKEHASSPHAHRVRALLERGGAVEARLR